MRRTSSDSVPSAASGTEAAAGGGDAATFKKEPLPVSGSNTSATVDAASTTTTGKIGDHAGAGAGAGAGGDDASGDSGSESKWHPCAFSDADQLTMFADYRVPQPLRELGLLVLSDGLKKRIDAGEELLAGSPEEVELRAASIQAVEALKVSLRDMGHDLVSIQIDWWLWTHGEAHKDELPPHHRTRTVFY